MRMAVFFVFLAFFVAGTACAQPALTLEALTDRKFYPELAPSEIHVEARVAMSSSAVPSTPAVRNVAFILDRSGSMAGEPVAALRRALAEALGALEGRDIVSVVLFGSEVETLIGAQRRDQIPDLAARIAQIEPAGGAALYDALNQAAALLRRQASPATINLLVLVTDGPPTKGPREAEDFARLAEVFAREGIILSTVGLGAEFNEDMLAAMARTAHGRFRYVAQPSELAGALVGEVKSRPMIVACDAVLTIEFKRIGRKLRSYGWRLPAMEQNALTWNFPQVFSDQPLAVLASAEVDGFYSRLEHADFAVVKLRWKSVAGAEVQELSRTLPVRFSRDRLDLRETLDAGVARSGAAAIVREGLQHAIEQLDEKNPTRALRELRTARNELRDLNFDLDDARIAEMGRQLDAHLAAAQRGTVVLLDRKVLRSGLNGQFEPPAPIPEPKN